jgi:hypothetical protein
MLAGQSALDNASRITLIASAGFPAIWWQNASENTASDLIS